MTVSIRLEIEKNIHKKIKLIQAKLLLDGKELSIPELCVLLLNAGVEAECIKQKIETK